MTKRTEQYLIVHAMALGAALLAAHTALTAVANLERLMGSAHPYIEAWQIVGTPFVLFPLVAQYLLNLGAGLKNPPPPTWDGIDRRAGTTETVTTTKAAGASDGSAPTVETRTATLTTTPPPPPDPSKEDTP